MKKKKNNKIGTSLNHFRNDYSFKNASLQLFFLPVGFYSIYCIIYLRIV